MADSTDKKLDAHLEEFRALRKEISDLIRQGDRWFQYATALSVALVGGALTAATSDSAKSATPLILIIGAVYLGTASLMYLRADIKRARVLKYIRTVLTPGIRESVAGGEKIDNKLMSWHEFSRDETDALRVASRSSISWGKWGYLGRTLVTGLLVVGAVLFLISGLWTLLAWENAPEETVVLWSLAVAWITALVWLLYICIFGWFIRKRPGEHGG